LFALQHDFVIYNSPRRGEGVMRYHGCREAKEFPGKEGQGGGGEFDLVAWQCNAALSGGSLNLVR